MGLSSFSTVSLEGVVAAAKEIGDIDHILQLYVMKNRRTSERLVRRAESMSTYFICILLKYNLGMILNLREQFAGVVRTNALQMNLALPRRTSTPLVHHFHPTLLSCS